MSGYTKLLNDSFKHGKIVTIIDMFDADDITVVTVQYEDGFEENYAIYPGGDIQVFTNMLKKNAIAGSRAFVADFGWPCCAFLVEQ